MCVTMLLTSSNQHCRWQTLPGGPGLSPISRDVIGLLSRFGSIIVKCQPIGVYRNLTTQHFSANLGRHLTITYILDQLQY